MPKLAVFVSGTSTLLEAMLEQGLKVDLVFADRVCRGITEVAPRFGVTHILRERATFGPSHDRAKQTSEILQILDSFEIEFVAMAGFMSILAPMAFNGRLQGRFLNSHPSLLPAFKGAHAVRDALNYGVKVTGCTVHVATAALDDGRIVAQAAVPVHSDDTEAVLHERIKRVERTLYPKAITRFMRSFE